jgi:hypothetical protein
MDGTGRCKLTASGLGDQPEPCFSKAFYQTHGASLSCVGHGLFVQTPRGIEKVIREVLQDVTITLQSLARKAQLSEQGVRELRA